MSEPARPDRLTAVLRAAQYLSNLSPDQDPWSELSQVIDRFFGCDSVAVAGRDEEGEPRLLHEPFSRGLPAGEVLGLVADEVRSVFETGFLGSRGLEAPACTVAVIPLPRDRRTDAVVIVGRAGQVPFSREELEILLATGGLFGNVLGRMETEQKARSHRQSLEQLVAQRTVELERTNSRLLQESAVRRQAEAALEKAHAELEQIFETAADGLRVLDRHGTVRRVNVTHLERLGRPASEILGRNCRELSPCAECGKEACPLTRIAAGASRVESEIAREYPQGAREEIVISTPFRARDGSLLGVVQVFHDITERKRAEEEVRRNREWLRVTLRSIGDAVIACDTAGRVTFTNPAAETLTGWAAEEALDQPASDILRLIHEQTRAPADDLVARVLRDGSPVAMANHTALVARNGHETPIDDSASPILDERGAVAGAVLVFHDVSAARQARQEREQTLDFLRLVNRSTGTADLLQSTVKFFQTRSGCEAAGIRLRAGDDFPYAESRGFSKEFIECDQRLGARDARGAVRRGGLGAPVLECLCGQVIAGQADPMMTCFTEGGSFWTSSMTRLLSGAAAGRRTCCRDAGFESVALVPLRVGAEPLGLLQLADPREGRFSRDRVAFFERLAGHLSVAVARSRTEERLRESEQGLREADRRKNEFLAVLSHELRNPLAPITNSLYVLDRAEPGSERARRALTVIGRQAGQLSRLVDDLLDLTRISRNKVHLQRRRLDLNELVKRTVEDHRLLFEQNGIHLGLAPAAQPVFLNGDPNRLAQVLGNLLTNSAKFTPRGGSTDVSVEVLAEQVDLRVRDTGIGIAPEVQARLFEPFTQADTSLDRSKGGLGLGLALVKGLAEMHGGSVAVRSDGLGTGSEFTVRLPLDSSGAAEPEAKAAANATPRRVLIIEDNLDAADTLREVLQFSGHSVEVAFNGPDGIAAAREFRPEVVLCDIGLPTLSGYDVARAFRADEALKGMFLVALSGYALPEDQQRAKEAGFDGHLAKPPSLEKLEKVLETLTASG